MPIGLGTHVYRDTRYVFPPLGAGEVRVVVENRNDVPVEVTVAETVPPGWTASTAVGLATTTLAPGARVDARWKLVAPAAEGPVLFTGVLVVKRGTEGIKLPFETPVAVYPPFFVEVVEQLAEVRDRLVAVVNFHRINGHVLMLDAVELFAAHLNVPMSELAKRMVAKEFAFTQVGVPIARDLLDQVRRGDNKGVLGVDRIELEADDVDDPCDRELALEHGLSFGREVRS